MKPYAGSDFEEYRRLSKKAYERRTMEAVLDRLGFTDFSVAQQERPDAVVTFVRDGARARLGCEIQTLQNDGGPSGSAMRNFHSRWMGVMECVVETLLGDEKPVPYCAVDFRESSYDCLAGVSNLSLVEEFVGAGRLLRDAQSLTFPHDNMPVLSGLLRSIRVVESDGEGMLWWPSHLKSGAVPPMDETIVASVGAKSELAKTFDWVGADERALLLVAEGRGLTDAIMKATPVELPSLSDCPFTWVFVWDRFSEDIWSIYPEYGVICDGHQQVRRLEHLPESLRPFASGDRYPTRRKQR